LYMLLTGVCLSVPFLATNVYMFLGVVFFTGAFSSASYGTLFQLVTLYPKLATSFLSLGYASPGAILALVTLAVFGPKKSTDSTKLIMFFCISAGVVVLGFLSYLLLLWTSNDILNVTSAYAKALDDGGSEEERKLIDDDRKRVSSIQQPPIPYRPDNITLFKTVWASAVSIAVLMISRVCVYTLLPYFPSQEPNQAEFSQRLVFINLGCDLGGRFLTLITPSLPEKKAPVIILIGCLVQFISVNVILLYVYGNGIISPNDIVAQAGVAFFATITGYIQTACYAYAPLQTSVESKPQVAALMNIFTQIGNYVGLALSFTLQFTVPHSS